LSGFAKPSVGRARSRRDRPLFSALGGPLTQKTPAISGNARIFDVSQPNFGNLRVGLDRPWVAGGRGTQGAEKSRGGCACFRGRSQFNLSLRRRARFAESFVLIVNVNSPYSIA